jgi:very-short-patch-repair endonuclease
MTDAEKFLWSKVRMKQLNGYQFYRQRIISDYIVDFFCPRAKLVIEVDGGQHYSGKTAEADRIRDDYMRNLGLKVLRFTDTDVLTNVEGVVESTIENMGIREQDNPHEKVLSNSSGDQTSPFTKGRLRGIWN